MPLRPLQGQHCIWSPNCEGWVLGQKGLACCNFKCTQKVDIGLNMYSCPNKLSTVRITPTTRRPRRPYPHI